jgi:transposase
MRTVDDFARIRQALRDGLSARQIAKQFGVGRDTIRKAKSYAEPPPYTLSQPRPAPVFGPFRSFVDEILAADEAAPRKQRHTASQIYRRLVAEKGYTGKYDQVRRYLQQKRLDCRETFIPLEHRPGVRAEADSVPSCSPLFSLICAGCFARLYLLSTAAYPHFATASTSCRAQGPPSTGVRRGNSLEGANEPDTSGQPLYLAPSATRAARGGDDRGPGLGVLN